MGFFGSAKKKILLIEGDSTPGIVDSIQMPFKLAPVKTQIDHVFAG